MLQKWVESVFIKRTALTFAAGISAQWIAHQAPVMQHLSAWGISMTIHINPEVLADKLTVVAIALSQGAHEAIAAKYPDIGKWI